MEWERSSGFGSVYSWTTVWRPQTPSFTVPYVPVVVNMDEAWQILSNLIGCEHDVGEIGLRVSVEFGPLRGGIALPYFTPVGSDGARPVTAGTGRQPRPDTARE
jgi:uncharacterized OB-fold protein